MAVVVDTAVVAPAERFELWSHAASQVLYPMGVRRLCERPFLGRMWRQTLGPLDVFRVAGDASAVVRTPTTIARGDPENLHVAVLRRGRFVVRQDDRAGRIVGGEVSSYQSSRPFVVQAVEPFDLTLYAVPRELLGADADRLCRHTADRVPGGIAAPFLRDLADRLEDGGLPHDGERLAERVVDVVCGLLAAERRRPTQLLLAAIKAFIEAHLGDPRLGPEAIARAHFISTRYLHRLFEGEDATVAEWIRRARLERCRRDLADPALAGVSVRAVAARWGLPEPAHFSRAFRAAYGVAPREYRRATTSAAPA